jgi:hypothetical protein
MLTSEERTLLTDQQDRLIELFVQHDEAMRAEDWDRARDLEIEIDDAQEEAEAIRHGTAGSATASLLSGSARLRPALGGPPARYSLWLMIVATARRAASSSAFGWRA